MKLEWTNLQSAVNSDTIEARRRRPKQAQELRDRRRRACSHTKRFDLEVWSIIVGLIRQDMSTEQASDRLTLKDELSISHETIYQYIYADKQAGDDLWRHLRCQQPRRKH
nr:hypothetical protein [Nitrosomonas supralitoralis]